MNIIKALKNIQDRIKNRGDQILEKVALHLVFALGIGLTSLVAKVFLKKFVTKKYHFSSWKKHLPNQTFNKMY